MLVGVVGTIDGRLERWARLDWASPVLGLDFVEIPADPGPTLAVAAGDDDVVCARRGRGIRRFGDVSA